MRGRAWGAVVPRRARYRPRGTLRDASEVLEIPRWPLGWILIGAVVLLAGKSLVTVELGRFDFAIPIQARVLVPAGLVVIEAPERGLVAAVRIRDGLEVRKGDSLLQIASPATAEAIARVRRERREATLDLLRLEAQLMGDPRALSAPADADPALVERARGLLASRWHAQQIFVQSLRRDLERELAQRKKIVAVIGQAATLVARFDRRLAVEQALVERSFVSDARLDRVRGERALELDRKTELVRRLAETDLRIAATARKLKGASQEFRAQALAERAAAAERFRATSHALARTNRELRVLRAPADGVISSAVALAEGDAVAASQPLMKILPAESAVEIEARLPSHHLRWIMEGQRVALRFAPATREGPVQLDAEVAWISRDPVDDAQLGSVHPARFRIAARSYATRELAFALAARSDTSLATDIQLDVRSVIDLVVPAFMRRVVRGEAPAIE
jgi:multidrug resistance efflux pump